MLLQPPQYPSNNFDMLFTFTFCIDEDVIGIYYHKNVEFLYQNLIDVALKRSQYVSQSKRYHLVLKKAIADHKDHILFIAFSDPHLIVSIGQIELDKISSPT